MGGVLGVAEKTEKGGFTESCETGEGGWRRMRSHCYDGSTRWSIRRELGPGSVEPYCLYERVSVALEQKEKQGN